MRRNQLSFRPQLEALEDRTVPSTLTVTNNLGYVAPGSLPAEIAVAQSGDTIVFDPSLSGQTIDLGQEPGFIGGQTQLVIGKNLDIEGLGASTLAISGGGSRVFLVEPGVQATISGLTIENGNGKTGGYDAHGDDYKGGGILNYGTLRLNNCTVSGNRVNDGGFFGGGGIWNTGAMSLNGCTVTGNSASFEGGGIYNAGTLTMNSSAITGNSAGYMGGGIYNDVNANLALYYSSVTGNTASSGADLYSLGTAGQSHSVIGIAVGKIRQLKGH